jgi:membrane protein
MMGAIRAGLSAVTGAEQRRPFVHGKLVDLAMVLLAGGAILVSTAMTLVSRLAQDELLAPIGLSGAWGVSVEVVAPVLLAFVVLVALLRLVPATQIAWEGVWRGALGGALALWVLTNCFAFYVQGFSRYNAVYGSLGAVVAFLVFVFLAAIVLLMTAAAAARWCEVGRASRPVAATGGPSPAVRVRRALAGLVGRH